jgi:hypothetical protein
MKTLLLAALAFSPTIAAAETVTRWTPQQIEAAKEAAAVRNMKADNGVLNGSPSDRRVHGEVGVAIGTGGYRSVLGSAAMPLGQNGVFAFSFENSQFEQGRSYRRH